MRQDMISMSCQTNVDYTVSESCDFTYNVQQLVNTMTDRSMYANLYSGRWNNTERPKRKYQYVFVCGYFRDLLLPKYYAKRRDILKFNEILN